MIERVVEFRYYFLGTFLFSRIFSYNTLQKLDKSSVTAARTDRVLAR